MDHLVIELHSDECAVAFEKAITTEPLCCPPVKSQLSASGSLIKAPKVTHWHLGLASQALPVSTFWSCKMSPYLS